MSMNLSTVSRRIAAGLAGPVIVTGVFAGAVALGPPASAAPQGMTCVTAQVVATPPGALSLLPRPGQIEAASGFVPQDVSATSCIGH